MFDFLICASLSSTNTNLILDLHCRYLLLLLPHNRDKIKDTNLQWKLGQTLYDVTKIRYPELFQEYIEGEDVVVVACQIQEKSSLTCTLF